jgi:hypothetical protein
LVLSPIPTNGQIRFSRPVEWAEVLDMNGRVVLCVKNQVQHIDCTSLEDGMYVLKSDAGNQRFVIRH